MRFLVLFFFLTSSLFATPKVVVSIAPTKFLVQKIAGDEVRVEKFVPEGASPHSFEPTPKQLLEAAKGDIWFRIGEGFEGKALDVVKTKIVNLREGLSLISGPHCKCHPNDIYDPHIWLSVALLKAQAKTITKALSGLIPDSAFVFESNLAKLTNDLDELDSQIHSLLDTCPRKYILVTHPAFGYFCRDYGLTQLSIETDGKEPSPKQIADLLKKAKSEKIDRLILEPQHNSKGGLRMADELRVPVIWLDPYQENVIENMKNIAEAIAR